MAVVDTLRLRGLIDALQSRLRAGLRRAGAHAPGQRRPSVRPMSGEWLRSYGVEAEKHAAAP